MHPTAWAWLSSLRTGFQKIIPLLLGLPRDGAKGCWHLRIGRGQGTEGGREKLLEYETPDNLNWILKFTFRNHCLLSCWSWTSTLLASSYQETFLRRLSQIARWFSFFKQPWELLQMPPNSHLWEVVLMSVRRNAGTAIRVGTLTSPGTPSGWKHTGLLGLGRGGSTAHLLFNEVTEYWP